MEKEILFIDMDGVCADFEERILRDYPDFDFSQASEGEDGHKFVDEYCEEINRSIFLELQVMKDAIKSVHLLDKLYNIYFLSTPMWNVPESYTHKRIWLENHFGEMVHKKVNFIT